MKNLNTTLLSFNSLVSRAGEDARVLPLVSAIDFTVDPTWVIDLTALVQSARLVHPIQAVYIDASSVAFGVTTLTVNSTGQKISIPAGAQGYYPLLIGSRTFIFTLFNASNYLQGKGTGTLSLHFVTVPMAAAEWNTTAVSGSTQGGPLTGPVRVTNALTDNASASDGTILCNVTNVTGMLLNLPASLSPLNTLILHIVKIDNNINNAITISGNGAQIIGSGSTITMSFPYQSATLQWTGSAWQVIGSHPGGWLSNFGIDYLGNGYLKLVTGLNVGTPANIVFGNGWLNWTPTVTAWQSMTVSNVSFINAQYLRIGPIVFWHLLAQMTLGGTASNQIFLTSPVPIVGQSQKFTISNNFLDGSGWQEGWGYMDPSGSLFKFERNGEVNYPAPCTVQIFGSGFYRCV